LLRDIRPSPGSGQTRTTCTARSLLTTFVIEHGKLTDPVASVAAVEAASAAGENE
jgi:hypothetical protein